MKSISLQLMGFICFTAFLMVVACANVDELDEEDKETNGPALQQVGNNGSPTSLFPLGLCEGDCDNDNECAGQLVCFNNNDDSLPTVPGCSGTRARGGRDNNFIDYCYDPTQTDDENPSVRFLEPSSGTVSANLGVVVDASDSDGTIAEVNLYIDDEFVRREGAAPYEWGTANSNKDDLALLNLAPGDYELRAVAKDNDGNETTATLTVTVEDNGDGDIEDVEFMDFESLSRDRDATTPFGGVDAQYLIYVESWGRNGHNNISMTENTHKCPEVEGATLVGVGGGQDKFIALYEINRSNITIHNTGGSAQILFMRTDQHVTLDARSVDPAIGSEKITGPENENQIVLYAEDEGGKGTRDEFFMPKAMEYYGRGDDLLYLFGYGDLSPTNDDGPNGNGAVGTLTFR